MSQIYSFRRGDTLGKVARRFGTSVDALAQANNIQKTDRVAAGAQLRIPDSFETQPAQGSSRTHTVRRGDTLSQLANRYGTSVDALAQANNIRNPDRILEGQRLRIPGEDSFSPRPEARPTQAPTRAPRPEARPTRAPTRAPRPEARPTRAPTTALRPEARPTQAPTTALRPEARPPQGPTGDIRPEARPPQGPTGDIRPEARPPQGPTGDIRPEARPPQGPTGDIRPEARPPQPPTSDTAQWRDEQTGREFSSRDGVPVFNQNDPAWGAQDLGTGRSNNTIGSAGCAISATAMAVSALSGQTVTPQEMDQHLDTNGGYQGDHVDWGVAAGAVQSDPPVTASRHHGFSVSDIDAQLAEGRPVVIGVDYKNGQGTDHWMTVTGRNEDGTYNVNDPAGGRTISMAVRDGQLVSADEASNGNNGQPYRFDGNAVTFGGGNPNGGVRTAGTEAPASPTGAVGSNGFRSITPEEFRQGGTNSLAAIVIGNAEGTRTDSGGFTEDFGSHPDPVNQARNIGSFSVQGDKAIEAGGDPYRADEIQLRELAGVTPAYEEAVRAAGLDPNNALLLASYYDMQTQSPATAAQFLEESLPTLAREGVTPENIINARVQAFYNNGKTGGWHDDPEQVVRDDAERRMGELVSALRDHGLAE
jgi:LysM repeat protein